MENDGSELYRTIGSLIERARRSVDGRKVTQIELANHVGLTRTSIVNIERGKHRVQIHLLYKIAAYLGVEPDKLLPKLQKQAKALPEEMRDKISGFKAEDQETVTRIIMNEVSPNATERLRKRNRKTAVESANKEATSADKKNRRASRS